MTEKLMRDAVNELNKIKQILAAMNVNHAEIGKLVKTWLEVEESVELGVVDREAFVIGQAVRCTDISSVHYKHIGTIRQIASGPVYVDFQHLMDSSASAVLTALQLEILPQPKLKIGDKVRVIDPHSIAYKEIGEVQHSDGSRAEVKFPSGSGGDFNRRNLELVEAYQGDVAKPDNLGRQYPRNWRMHFGMSTLPVNWTGANHEDDLLTEEAFRLYQAGVIAENKGN